jgi:hypothetical protein
MRSVTLAQHGGALVRCRARQPARIQETDGLAISNQYVGVVFVLLFVEVLVLVGASCRAAVRLSTPAPADRSSITTPVAFATAIISA